MPLSTSSTFRQHVEVGRYYMSIMNRYENDFHRFHRSMTRPFFTRDRITQFELYDRHADAAISQMKHRLRSGYSVDIQARRSYHISCLRNDVIILLRRI